MATINLGSIKFKWQGAYNGATAYTVDDVVSYNGSSYICILASTGNLPTNATYWEQMSQKGTDGTNGTDGTDLGTTLTTQGDIVYRGASGLARLGAGTSGQVLQTGGTGANPSWGTVSSDYVKLATGTIGSVGSISIDGYYTSDYDYYKLIFMNIRNDTANRQFRWRFNSSGSPLTGTNYRFIHSGAYIDSTAATTTNHTGGWNTDFFATNWDLSTGTDRGSQIEIDLYDPLSTTNNKFCYYRFIMDSQDTAYTTSLSGGGYYNGNYTSAFSGITIFPQGGNFAGGMWKLYGIKG